MTVSMLGTLCALLLLAAASAATPGSGSGIEGRRSHRLLLQGAANTFVPEGGKGSWESGGSTGIITIHAILTKDGKVVTWANKEYGFQEYSSAIYDPATKTATQLLDDCGLHACKNAFCGGMVLTKDDEVLIFGGHARDIPYWRHWKIGEDSVYLGTMPSPRWYPGVATLPDGKILVVGGVDVSGDGGYHAEDEPESDNPTYDIYDPATKTWAGDQAGMQEQLQEAFPIHTYPHVFVMPDGGVVVSAGSTLVKYVRNADGTFTKEYSMAPRPGAPWSYPQTGSGTVLPMFPPYDKVEFLAAGGVAEDRADKDTPASAAAEVIELTGGEGATWREVGPMPYSRVMGDAVILCDGTVLVLNGAGRGIAGWDKTAPQMMTQKDGSQWYCDERCSKAFEPRYAPVIFDPATSKWSAPGSLAEAQRQRLYHSIGLLLPDCSVMTGGSDTTWDQTAEIFRPPYLSKGPQPVIDSVSAATIAPGTPLTLKYTSEDPVTRALLTRTGAHTHSMAFDQRAFWLQVAANSEGTITLRTPPTSNLMPPGHYMVTILSDKGVPSAAKIVTVTPSTEPTSEARTLA